jgi:NAD(P)-dependent dehydrogenase (short-subunit alcohol dehydrogenase family)
VATSLVVGGSSGLGRFIAEHVAEQGDDVIITSRNPKRAQEVAAEIGGTTRGLAVTLAQRLRLTRCRLIVAGRKLSTVC